ncbi:cytochrome P460 family protein [Mesorhizobium huakuii]|uniref:cytochrome P460 family protein n=1 Tax=Mesorhizobium huakuii TaxID=28104 RepID=UPI001FD41727|nr:cytochrome P460 family protein [Mesorhizobium huakuii]
MEKGEGWGLDFSAEQRTGDWHFQQFNAGMQVLRTSFAERCQSCHLGAAPSDFMFTRDRMGEIRRWAADNPWN